MYGVLAILTVWCWSMYAKKSDEMDEVKERIAQMEASGNLDELPKLKGLLESVEGEKTFEGILLTFLSAGLVGILFVVHVLPFFAHRITHAVYDSAEMVEKDVMHAARSLKAQGDFEGAVKAYIEAAAAEPMNRVPWMEIAKIQKDQLGDPAAAIQTIRHALESQEWEINDAAYFLFRLAELYDEVNGDRATAVAIMQQVIEQFPETRHSANANNKLKEWNSPTVSATTKAAGLAASVTDEEAEFLARLKRAEAAEQTGQPGQTS